MPPFASSDYQAVGPAIPGPGRPAVGDSHYDTPASPILSSGADARSSADAYRALSPHPPLSPLSDSLGFPSRSAPEVSRDSIAMSSIHSGAVTPTPNADASDAGRFLGAHGRNGSNATWADASDDDLPRGGVGSPFLTEGGGGNSTAVLNRYDDGQGHTYPRATGEKAAVSAQQIGRQRRRMLLGVGGAVLLLALALGIGLGVSLSKKGGGGSNNSSGSGSSGGTTTTQTGSRSQLWGSGPGNVTTTDGETFFYNNTLGGTWVAVPFNDTAKPQDNQPALNQKWNYGVDRIFGVNIGGWLVLEPFITPGMFEPYENNTPAAIDEWTLCEILGTDMASTIENHYRTFITEQDFAEIAAAGLNWVRIPIGWWAIETWDGEPFLEGVAFKYFLKALDWARKYGLRVNLDLHSVPGSQNGYNHSGKFGSINFLYGLMGVANSQRTLNYIRILTEFVSQPQYSNVVPMFSVLNEALMSTIGSTQLRQFYYQVYEVVRGISGIGEGKGPFMVIHDGFGGTGGGHKSWGGFLAGADRLGLDTHPYLCFSTQYNYSMSYNAFLPCQYWATDYNQTMTEFGFNMAGEYSVAINDCGKYLNNVGWGSRFDGTYPNASAPLSSYPRVGSCDYFNDYTLWDDAFKNGLANMAWATQDAMMNSFFWTWKIGPLNTTNLIPNPFWNYQLGLKEGWIRPDARRSNGGCAVAAAALGTTAATQSWAGTLAPWQTGGSGAGTIAPAQVSNYSAWPPVTLSGAPSGVYQATNLPEYTPTGKVLTLSPTQPAASLFPSGATGTAAGNGWAQPSDTIGWWVSANGCSYPNPWSATGLPEPASACPGVQSLVARGLPEPTPAPMPMRR